MAKGSTFGGRLREAREKAKMSQKELSVIVKMEQTAISALERGINTSTPKVFALADALKVDARWLATGSPWVGENKSVDKKGEGE